jgi:hypothetical protein
MNAGNGERRTENMRICACVSPLVSSCLALAARLGTACRAKGITVPEASFCALRACAGGAP